MYFMSRAKDITGITYNFFNKKLKITATWLVTNAYLTSDSIKFAAYYKMNLLAWDYPKNASLKLKVDDNGQYPITCLTSLDALQKDTLLKAQCILVKDIIHNPRYIKLLSVDTKTRKAILAEACELINSPLVGV